MTHRPADTRLPRQFLPLDDAKRKARRAFCRGVACGLALAGVIQLLDIIGVF
jgi:hypothetical protein